MNEHSVAFKHLLALQDYCEKRVCENCCFYLGDDHDNTGYCVFDNGLPPSEMLVLDEHEQISKRVDFLASIEEAAE